MKKIIAVVCGVFLTVSGAMADRIMPIYGLPTLYGEYEFDANDTKRAAAMYGNVPKNAVLKMPIKAKRVVAKKALKKKKSQKKIAKNKPKEIAPVLDMSPIPTDDIIIVPPREIVPDVQIKIPQPSVVAIAIAGAAMDAAPNLESFCTRRGVFGRGRLPDGFVLMPGRPDLMSCVDK